MIATLFQWGVAWGKFFIKEMFFKNFPDNSLQSTSAEPPETNFQTFKEPDDYDSEREIELLCRIPKATHTVG